MNKSKNTAKGRNSRKQKDWKADKSRNNMQDAMSAKEYDKGLRAGEATKSGKSKFSCDIADHKSNDPQWYFKSADILNDVASFSFNHILGSKFNPDTIITGSDAWSNWAATIPGLLTLHVGPTIGVSVDSQSPINLAATNVYSYVRYKNSGHVNYDAPDLMMYLLSMDSLYACWNWMKRIYGFASTYSQLNRYQPQAYFAANGIDMDDILSHLADFRGYLNIAADRISVFCVPATMTYNVRHSWLFSNIYKDSEVSKAQQYMFVPTYFYKYDETSNPKGGQLTPVPLLTDANFPDIYNATPGSPTLLKFSDLRNYLDTLIEQANYSEDVGIMSGDILKAYGEGNLFKLSHFDPDYKVEPVYSQEVLMQIENADTTFNTKTDYYSDFTITQDPNTNWIICNPPIRSAAPQNEGITLNFHMENPTPEDVIVATRLCSTAAHVTGAEQGYYTSFGSELMYDIKMWWYGQNFEPNVKYNKSLPLVLMCGSLHTGFIEDGTVVQHKNNLVTLIMLSMLMSFDWAPRPIVRYDSTVEPDLAHDIYLWASDWATYTTVYNTQLETINEVALLTEFNVPN